jgi:hypothetical protein
MNGIIAALTTRWGGNVADKSVVDVIFSACLDQTRFAPRNVADLEARSNFVSENTPGQWVGYYFKGRRLKLTGYGIRSRYDGWANSNNLKQWVVEVSDDNSTWFEADRRDGNDELNGTDRRASFAVTQTVEGQYVRIRQTGKAHSGKDFLAVSGFEVFGTLFE